MMYLCCTHYTCVLKREVEGEGEEGEEEGEEEGGGEGVGEGVGVCLFCYRFFSFFNADLHGFVHFKASGV